jgi:hypothetical protein
MKNNLFLIKNDEKGKKKFFLKDTIFFKKYLFQRIKKIKTRENSY